ncbi:acyl-CoA thioesterase [Neisseria leonii]|uniref:acyl-CoA thioesterase n=1 Tax=Neisseria leonii TaxID=2995413 RepID=UPI0038621C80
MQIPVRGYHLDGYRHVNNARYLEFLEEARWAYFEEHNLLPLLGDMQIVVTRVDIRYRRSATFGDVLHLRTGIAAIEPRQVVVRQIIDFNDDGKPAAEAEVTLVPVAGGRGADLPDALYRKLQQMAAE